jgi:hypothetical protein
MSEAQAQMMQLAFMSGIEFTFGTFAQVGRHAQGSIDVAVAMEAFKAEVIRYREDFKMRNSPTAGSA